MVDTDSAVDSNRAARLMPLSRRGLYFFGFCLIIIILFAVLLTYVHFADLSLGGANAFTWMWMTAIWPVWWIAAAVCLVFVVMFSTKFPRLLEVGGDAIIFHLPKMDRTLRIDDIVEIAEDRYNNVAITTPSRKRDFVIPMRMLKKPDQEWLRHYLRVALQERASQGRPVKGT
jgi:hypothetical protein